MKPILQGLLHSLLMIVGVLLLVYALSTFSQPVQAQWCNDPLFAPYCLWVPRGFAFPTTVAAVVGIAVTTKLARA
jgi:hypothetical protein